MAKLVQLTKVLDWEELLEKINEEKEECIVKKGKKPVAVVMPYVIYQNWLRSQKEAKKSFFETVEKIWERNKDVDPEEVERVVGEAVKAVRGEL